MASYRIYFLASGSIRGREDFEAENDFTAIRMARVLSDACSDECQTFELWLGPHKIDPRQAPEPSNLADLTETHQQIVIKKEEVIRDSAWAIARSRRLLERLEGMIPESDSRPVSNISPETSEPARFGVLRHFRRGG